MASIVRAAAATTAAVTAFSYAWLNNAASIQDARFAGGADPTGVADCSDVIEAIWTAGYSTILLSPGTYRITRTIDLSNTRSLIGPGSGNRGAGTGAPIIQWDGAAGGTAIRSFIIDTSDRYKTYSGSLIGFRLRYPSTKLATGSCGIYLGRPTAGQIAFVEVSGDTDNVTVPKPASSYGWHIDGCENPGPIQLYACKAGHHWSEGFRVAASHVTMIGCSAFYTGDGVHVTQDSIDSPAGPPYNVEIMGLHSYYPTTAHVRVSRTKSFFVRGGFCEPEPTSSPTSFILASTFDSLGGISGHYRTRGSLITHFGTGQVRVDNPQDATGGLYIGNSTTGVPASLDGLPSRLVRRNNAFATITTTSTTQRTITGSTPVIQQGLSGVLRYRLTGRVKNSDGAGGYQIGVIQLTNTIAANTVNATSPRWQPIAKTVVDAADTWEYFDVTYEYSGQNGNFYFAPVWNVIGSGTITTDMVTLTVDAL